jgi:hypothetical protein
VSVSSIAATAVAAYIKEETEGAREARLCEEIALIVSTVNGQVGTASEKADAMASLLHDAMKAEGIYADKAFYRYASVQFLSDLPGKSVSEKDVSRLFDQYLLRME